MSKMPSLEELREKYKDAMDNSPGSDDDDFRIPTQEGTNALLIR